MRVSENEKQSTLIVRYLPVSNGTPTSGQSNGLDVLRMVLFGVFHQEPKTYHHAFTNLQAGVLPSEPEVPYKEDEVMNLGIRSSVISSVRPALAHLISLQSRISGVSAQTLFSPKGDSLITDTVFLLIPIHTSYVLDPTWLTSLLRRMCTSWHALTRMMV